jgi:septum formation topological specificity factor MinE
MFLIIYRLREAFSRWRTTIYTKHNSIQGWSDSEKIGFVDEHTTDITKIKRFLVQTTEKLNTDHKLKTIFNSWYEVTTTQSIAKRKLSILIHKKRVKTQTLFIKKWNENIINIKTIESKISNMKVKRDRNVMVDVLRQLRGDTASKKLL